MYRLLVCICALTLMSTMGCTMAHEDVGAQDYEHRECPEGGGVLCPGKLPFRDFSTTSDGNAQLDGYGCDEAINESGPEKVYRVDVPHEGLLVASVEDDAGVDVDVHILQALDVGSCIDRGDSDAVALVSPGRYFIVVDSFVDSSGTSLDGDFKLTVILNTADDHADDSLHPTVYGTALRAFDRAWKRGETEELEYGVIDYGLLSTTPRFFVVNLRRRKLLFAELTSHGIGSQDPTDTRKTGHLSNVPDSKTSSIGLVRAAETYHGSKGYSMRLDGLEPGFNDKDRSRAIVVHKADYATQSYANNNGYLGRSWGCPALDPAINRDVIDTLSGGRLLLKYFDDATWLDNSAYVAD